MIRSWDFNCKDFGGCIDWLRLAAQSLFRISGHPELNVISFVKKKNVFNCFLKMSTL